MPIATVLVVGLLVVTWDSSGQVSPNESTIPANAARAVEQMRGISMQRRAAPRSDGRIDGAEERKSEITRQLHQLGSEAIPALARALSDADVQMRRNAALVLIMLGGGYSAEATPKLGIRGAMPALIVATQDPDTHVRAWAAHALAEMGPGAQPALPALVRLLRDAGEGPRNNASAALARVGPGAGEALPVLREALRDPSADVRRCAQHAIERIQAR